MHGTWMKCAADVASVGSDGDEQNGRDDGVLSYDVVALASQEQRILQVGGHAVLSCHPERLRDQCVHRGLRIQQDMRREVAGSDGKNSGLPDVVELVELLRSGL